MIHLSVLPESRVGAARWPAVAVLVLLLAAPVSAGGHKAGQWASQQGASAPLSSGDYISSSITNGGLDTYYSFWIEVPPNVGQMTIGIFDADTGGIYYDILTGTWNTTTRYQIYDPNGNLRVDHDISVDYEHDGSWDLVKYDEPLPGHWEVRVDTSTAVTDPDPNGDDTNVFGIRAQDTSSLAQIYYWWLDGDSPGWTTTGGWAYGQPSGVGGSSNGNPDPTSGSCCGDINVYGYNLDGDYSAPMAAKYLTTTAIDCSGLSQVELVFWRCLNVGPAPEDNASIEVSPDGSNWTEIWHNPEDVPVTDSVPLVGDWPTMVSYDISAVAADQSTVYIRWVMGPIGSRNPYSGWNIDDIEIYGMRPLAELNIYAESFVHYGLEGEADDSQTFDLYPYVTYGCELSSNDFDADSAASIDLTSRSGDFTQAVTTVSGDAAWESNSIIGWTSDEAAAEYGIWSEALTVTVPEEAGSNFLTHYLGDDRANPPPPVAQPEYGSLRLYLPTDAGEAPLKPYVGQELFWVGGPNPPQAGQSTRVRVQVSVTNPTPYPIDFKTTADPSNIVSAYVPGGEVVYAGSAYFSQGTIQVEPSPGGSGWVEWAPGIVAAGALAAVSYQLDVTPAAADERVPVTGTPADGFGTTARFVDETGNTNQARATLTFGPLCGLAVTAGGDIPTRVLLADFGGEYSGGRPVLRWSTAAETGTAGFRLLRWDEITGAWIPLHDGILPALPGRPQGGVYRCGDPSARPGETARYALEEIEAGGGRRTCGPFVVTWDGTLPRREEALPAGNFTRTAHTAVRPPAEATAPARAKAAGPEPVALARPAAAQLRVTADRLYRVSRAEIAAALGLKESAVRRLWPWDRLSLSCGGRPVAWFPSPDGDDLFFYGRAPDSPYTRENVYQLAPGKPLAMAASPAGVPLTAVAGSVFTDRLDVEEDHIAAPFLFQQPEADFWFWDYLYAGHPTLGTKSFALTAPDPAPTGTAELTVRLHGATDTPAVQDHCVEVRLNGRLLGEMRWDGRQARELRFPVDPAALSVDGANEVTLTALLGSGVPYSMVYVDGFSLDYLRSCQAEDDRLRLRALTGGVVTVQGFRRSDVVVLDVTDPDRPSFVTAQVERSGGGWRATFRALGPEREYLAVALGAASPVAAVTPERPSRLRNPANAADYVVIAPADLLGPAAALAAWRESRGLRTLVADLADIYNDFNDGLASPEAVREFLEYAVTNWRVAPRYVVLAGRGTLDYRNVSRCGDNRLPPLLVGTPFGLVATDNRFACWRGDDNIPELAVGRLPAVTATELQTMVDKIVRYESQPAGEWASRVLLAADDPDAGGDFSAAGDALAARLPAAVAAERLYLSEMSTDQIRTELLSGIRDGALLVGYVGHGGMDRLAAEGLLTMDDVASLTGGAQRPMLLAMTCTVGDASVPGYPGLGESLVACPGGGMAACYAPAGLSDNDTAVKLGQAVLSALFDPGATTLGTAIRNALSAWSPDNPALAYHRDIYGLLGDPAMSLPRSKGSGPR